MPLRLANPRRLASCFLLLSAAAAVVLLACRNLYDDELLSLAFVTDAPRQILAVAREGDVHPPGMYLLAHLGWLLTHSYRWLNLVPTAVLYAGLARFVLAVTPLLRTLRGRVCFLLLATLGPELLVWGDTFRWYCPWTGLALGAVGLALQPGVREPGLRTGRALALGVLLAALFYLNYITVLFAFALLVAMAARYRAPLRLSLRQLALTAASFVVLVAPQLHTMVAVHLRDAGAQRGPALVSALRLVQALAGSEAYLPWHPLALAAGVVLLALWALGVCRWLAGRKKPAASSTSADGLGAITLCACVFLLLLAASGLGAKPRNGLVLVPLLAPAAVLGLETLAAPAQFAVLGLLAVWCGMGIVHLAAREGLAKGSMGQHAEEVAALVARVQQSRSDGSCAITVVYDPGAAFALTQANLPRLVVVSPYRGAPLFTPPPQPDGSCMHSELYVVESYINGSPAHIAAYTNELHAAEQRIAEPRTSVSLSPDPSAARRRQIARLVGLASSARLPDAHFTVVYGAMQPGGLAALSSLLPDFQSLSPGPVPSGASVR